MARRFPIWLLCIALPAGLVSCAVRSAQDRGQVSAKIEQRTGHGLGPASEPGKLEIPPAVSLDALSEDDAVAVALWNNAALQADLAELGFARAALLEAGLLKNPVFSILFPLGPKQLEFTLTAPIELLWQRPRRIAAATLEAERVAESLVQNGLDLVAAVKTSYAGLALAQALARQAAEAERLHGEILEITEARLRAGDISELEVAPARIQALHLAEEAARARHEVGLALERLRGILGLGMTRLPLGIRPGPVSPVPVREAREWIAEALAARPDLRAAEISMEAAAGALGWERSRVWTLSGMLDANGQGKEGFEAGPGLVLGVPIFDTNRGGITRAEAEMERAARRYADVQQRIVTEVREAATILLQASADLNDWRGRILPALEETQGAAERSYAAGDASYLFVLENKRALLAARRREMELIADVRRAGARLERSIGKKP